MSISEKFEVIADEVYKKGYSKAELDFWNHFTSNGKRGNYINAFLQTDFSDVVIPEGLCKPTSRITSMFYNYFGTKLPKNVDCSSFSSTTSANHADSMFAFSYSLTEIYDLGIPVQKTYNNFVNNCYELTKIEVMRSDENTTWTYTFNGCSKLEYLRIEGVIGQAFSVSGCNKLDHDSLMSIINALKNIKDTGTTKTCTLGSTNLAKLTTAEKAIATDKGWTLA